MPLLVQLSHHLGHTPRGIGNQMRYYEKRGAAAKRRRPYSDDSDVCSGSNKFVRESRNPSSPTQKGRQLSIEGEKPSNPLESVNSDRKNDSGKGLITRSKLEPRHAFINYNSERLAMNDALQEQDLREQPDKASIKRQRISWFPAVKGQKGQLTKMKMHQGISIKGRYCCRVCNP
ncbi:hypothetical protein N7499_001535 [Penicillium canescens]|uniref:Uncharacterized protein n=1 Tax=Penicillium canescens TaxID=5083 RepID=A0AAD6N691_PENCN|nr:uncharacterized protein N7446_009076 [Penicillium canescens]KAJ6034327.1 hypothetical protein N7460_008502 [Penicillium canescens]KAJ6045989.1 hypothetical protein N7444_007243 [Penicillium canescens]KAJ6053064.1 hypothetical protein N7446_009076 [Penicillium canescens]KAJ6097161.1 hypothetical protein N7499_001535 [Penicillium canescens]KAJ6165151.1 hypothetical protein N7485_008395 [Penicillium canescens]